MKGDSSWFEREEKTNKKGGEKGHEQGPIEVRQRVRLDSELLIRASASSEERAQERILIRTS
jgi:hypothetical protein